MNPRGICPLCGAVGELRPMSPAGTLLGVVCIDPLACQQRALSTMTKAKPPTPGWSFDVMVKPHGKHYEAILLPNSKYASLGLSSKSDAFEKEVARVMRLALPRFGDDDMIGIRVRSIIKRPKYLLKAHPGRLHCPVRPDAANVLKCVEDAMMRCRTCQRTKGHCASKAKAPHDFRPTIRDDATIVDDGCKTLYSAVVAGKARGPRVEVDVWLIGKKILR